MLTQTHNPINAAAAKRILGVSQSRRIEFISVSQTAIVIRCQDETYTLTPEQFAEDFIAVRRAGARECIAQPHKRGPWGETFHVVGSKGDTYYVEGSDRALACTCEDFANHQMTCKHGYAVLNLLGLTTLDEYRVARAQVAYPQPAAYAQRRISGRLCVGHVGIE